MRRAAVILDRAATAARLLGAWRHRLTSALAAARCAEHGGGLHLRQPLSLIGLRHVRLGSDVQFGAHLRLEAFAFHNGKSFSPRIDIGDRFSGNDRLHIAAINHIQIGNDVLVGSDVYISDHAHGDSREAHGDTPPARRILTSKGPVYIGDRVWIGSKVCILPGVTVGHDAIIGAGSVVTRDIPPRTVAAGIPARALRGPTSQLRDDHY